MYRFIIPPTHHPIHLFIDSPLPLPSLSLQVLSADGVHTVGKITKQWSGLAKEMFTDADNFGISCE